jgi:FAD/FMN-containing dehydrogenase
MRDRLVDDLRASLGGAVLADPAQVEPYAGNFGGVWRGRPRAVVLAAGEEDVVRTVTAARGARVRVVVRGAGHSGHPSNVCDGGILLVLRQDDPELRLVDGGNVEVAAGTSWRALQSALCRAGRSAPVLTNHLDLTVGGTLAVGGYGLRSIVDGSQVDHVVRLRLVTPDGRPRWCAPTEDAGLFRYALAGLGQIGVITRAVMRTVPYDDLTDLYLLEHGDVDELVTFAERAASTGVRSPDHFEATWTERRILSHFGRGLTSLERALVGGPPPTFGPLGGAFLRTVPHHWLAHDREVAGWHAAYKGHRHLWGFFALGSAEARSFLRWCGARRRESPAARYLAMTQVLAVKKPSGSIRLPLDSAALPGADLVLGVGLYYEVPSGDDRGVAQSRTALRDALERCLALGGRPYRFSPEEMDEAGIRQAYGPAYEELRRLRRDLDPDGQFGSSGL